MANQYLMNSFLNSQHEEQDDYYEHEHGEYHASTSGACVRRNYFNIVDDVKPGQDAYPHFELGNRLEEIWIDVLKEEHGKRHVKNSIPIRVEQDDWAIIGETDPVVVDYNMEVEHLWEVKTTSNLSYVRSEPKEEHVYQVHCYMMGLGNPPSTSIVYLNKKNLDTVIHEVSFDPEIWMDIVDRFTRLHEALEADEPPEPQEEGEYFCDHGAKCCENQ